MNSKTPWRTRTAQLVAFSIVAMAGALVASSEAASAATAPNAVSYRGHVQGSGWSAYVGSGQTIGRPGSNLRLEAAQFRLPGITYTAHVQSIGWQPWVGNGATAGTTGRNLRMEAIKIKVPTGCTATYRSYVRTLGWQPWVSSGALSGTTGRGLSIDGLQLNVTCTATTTFVAAADFGLAATGTNVMRAMGGAQPTFTHLLGDFAYVETSAGAAKFCANANAALPGMANEMLMGNHDPSQAAAYLKCLPDRIGATGPAYGWQYVIDQGPVRIIATSPGLNRSGLRTYNAGTAEYNWVAKQIDAARAAGKWVVVSMHKPCISVGLHQCIATSPNYAPRELTNLLLSKRVDVVISGHDHNYSRTHQITGSVPSPTRATLTTVDRDGSFVAGKGTVFLVLGNGGYNPRGIVSNTFTASMAKSWSGASLGYGRFTVTDRTLSFKEVPVAPHTFTDSFTITR